MTVEKWNTWWNKGTVILEEWNRDGRTVMVEKRKRDCGKVEQ